MKEEIGIAREGNWAFYGFGVFEKGE